ncbi:ECs_2282 family putative zinc-binding protein [Enterobacter ludwigii]|uniref:ECs_2282 family putative zinc-binding protein n=2 Tax=Enterobacteriaceae TaxID=543 RepID=UPI000643D313|nr:hypothetical protein [Enterobacter ludwigii]KLP40178.1 hypothetical protein ABR36_09875 [Enterobacter ludwigii]
MGIPARLQERTLAALVFRESRCNQKGNFVGVAQYNLLNPVFSSAGRPLPRFNVASEQGSDEPCGIYTAVDTFGQLISAIKRSTIMSNVPFKCPGCNHDLTVHCGTEISDVADVTGTTCANCGRTVDKDDLIQQAREHATILVRNLLGKLPE